MIRTILTNGQVYCDDDDRDDLIILTLYDEHLRMDLRCVPVSTYAVCRGTIHELVVILLPEILPQAGKLK